MTSIENSSGSLNFKCPDDCILKTNSGGLVVRYSDIVYSLLTVPKNVTVSTCIMDVDGTCNQRYVANLNEDMPGDEKSKELLPMTTAILFASMNGRQVKTLCLEGGAKTS